MTTTRATLRVHYLNVNYGIKSWLFTTDHKRIALLYLTSITLFFFLGGAAAAVMRLKLLIPPGIWCGPRPTTSSLPFTASS
jgi:cytochrome c oxidase subunit 1